MRYIFFTYLFFIIPVVLCAQNCIWAKSGDGGSLNESHTVCTDKDGNVLITGIFAATTITFGPFTLTNNGVQNIFLTKYDSNGNVLWAKSGSSSGNDWAYSVDADKDGNVYISGYFDAATISFGSFTLTNAGQPGLDLYLVKYDPNGNVIWAKREGGADGIEAGFSVKTDLSRNVYLTGYSTSSVLTIGTYTFTDTDNPRAFLFLIKYDKDGNIIWAKSGDHKSAGYAVTTDYTGNVYLTGGFQDPVLSIGSYTLAKISANSNFFLVKLDSNGNILWGRNENVYWGYGLSTNAIGDVFVTGGTATPTTSIGSYTFTNNGGNQVFLAKYNSNGTVIWAKSFGDNSNDYAYSVATDASNLYATGRFNTAIIFGNYTLTAPPGSIDPMYFLRFDFNGNLVWATALASGGAGGNNQNWVCTDNASNVYITSGFQVNPFVVGSNTLTLTGSRNVFVAKYHFNDVGIQENNINNPIEIYPNPTTGIFFIEQNGANKITITNYLGQTVYFLKDSLPKQEIDLSLFSSGVYFLKAESKEGQKVFKVIKE